MSVRKHTTGLSVGLAVLLSAGAAGAATVSFAGLPEIYYPDVDGPWIEDGILVTPEASERFGALSTPGAAHMDDGGPYSSHLTFTTSGRFRASSLDLIGLPTSYVPNRSTCDDVTIPCVEIPYDNVLVAGFLDGVEVFSDRFSAGLSGNLTYTFPGAGILDLLKVSAVHPDLLPGQDIDDVCDDIPCGHFGLDAVVLAPVTVPLPPAGLLLLGGLAAVGAVARAKRMDRARAAG